MLKTCLLTLSMLFLTACSSGTSRYPNDLGTSWNALKFIIFIGVIMGVIAIVKKMFGKK
jgi:hypothetical protein